MSDEALSRRDFLLYGGGALAGITLGELGRRQLARADERAAGWRGGGVESWATSVCRECPAACGIRVRLMDGAPVKLEGNPRCPVSRGRLCAKGQASLESYFDPDRLRGPARRVGKRGDGKWEPITWDEAAALLASRLRDAGGGRQPVLAVAAEEEGPLADAWTRFWRAAGARVVWTRAATAARLGPAFRSLTGVSADPLFDLEHASYVLSFGAPVVEDWLSEVWTQRSYGRFRRGSGARGRLVQIEPRRSMTARKADEWLAVHSDRQAVLAYGIAFVLLRENRVNRAFLDELGGDLAAFEREVAANYTPDDVASVTGVPVVTVLRLARELAGSARPLAVVAADAGRPLVEAVFALNALIGAFDRAGGVACAPRGPAADVEDATATLRDVAAGRIRPAILALRDASALRALASPRNLEGALRPTDLVVSFSPFLDEAAAIADLLMPTHTALESWHATLPAQAVALEAVAIARPAVKPLLSTKDLVSLLKEVAVGAGEPLAGACGWTASDDVVRGELERLWGLRRGAPYADPHETEWVRQLEKGGWWVAPAPSPEAFAAAVAEAGGWADPYLAPGRVRESLRARPGLRFSSPAVALAKAAAGRPSARVGAAEYPLLLVPFKPALVTDRGSPNQPALYELLGQPDGAPWKAWAELSPETARALAVEAGAGIRIVSPGGAVEAVAVLVEKMPAEAVALAFVPAVPGSGRWARRIAPDVRLLADDDALDRGLMVRVTRA
jgi:anaerobic selenocysteine-containing dehydrogenase